VYPNQKRVLNFNPGSARPVARLRANRASSRPIYRPQKLQIVLKIKGSSITSTMKFTIYRTKTLVMLVGRIRGTSGVTRSDACAYLII
jgi:hypothetical protein